MIDSDQEVTVHRSVTVPLDRERAFALFTERQQEFWPAGHSIGTSPRAGIVVEPRVGGRWYERGTDGTECAWGQVLSWQPSELLVLNWQLGADWTHQPDQVTEVEVRFTEAGPGRTRLDLVHRHLERFGEQAERMRTVFESPGAWAAILDAFAGFAAA